MLKAREYLGSVGIGVTSPKIFRANDGQIYVVKLKNNPMGAKILVNEYVACWFGKQMGLCFPPSGLIQIGDALHFASQYMYKNRYVGKRDLKKAVNKQAMAGVMLFDHMFHNMDRTKNKKNLLVCRKEGEDILYAIDNSHLFIRGRWNVESLGKLAKKITLNRWRAYGWLLTHFLVAEDFMPYVKKVKGIRDEELTLLIASIPEEWLPLLEEREALLEYMIVRRNMIEEIVGTLYRLIPNIDRGSYFH